MQYEYIHVFQCETKHSQVEVPILKVIHFQSFQVSRSPSLSVVQPRKSSTAYEDNEEQGV
ncbi:hypothetical protein POPTR_011G093801v4 [Populus trichocarpa]|uniref:Uncharacterized protein n=1 Tax=Populus trichocarpa TaxID=3694 RepID=A0ACC0S7Y0_POPTR|nr:hypothetical protein POPTR_011G093801v4 [Populus trichocarpa]